MLAAFAITWAVGYWAVSVAELRHPGPRPVRNRARCQSALRIDHAEYEPPVATGDLTVATASYTFADASRLDTFADTGRPRWLTVGFYYPEVADRSADRSLPQVVFSPGALGVRSSNESLFTELASHGYVVAAIDHTHHSLYTTDQSGRRVWIDRGYVRELRNEDATTDPARSQQSYQWMDLRVADISFVIDHIAALAGQQGSDGVFRLVDMERIGVVGHSLGGSAALGVGRARDDIDAVIAVESPYMADIEDVQDDEFVWIDEPYPVPVLNIYSDSMATPVGVAAVREEP